MAREKKPEFDVATLQPDELGELKNVLKEFLRRYTNVLNEIDELNASKKDLLDEYKEKIDMKTLQAVLKVLKLEAKIAHKHTFDTFKELLTDDDVNGLFG